MNVFKSADSDNHQSIDVDMGNITSASISKKVFKVLVYMCTKFGTFFIKCTIDLVCRLTKFTFKIKNPLNNLLVHSVWAMQTGLVLKADISTTADTSQIPLILLDYTDISL